MCGFKGKVGEFHPLPRQKKVDRGNILLVFSLATQSSVGGVIGTACQNCGAENGKKKKHMIDLTEEPDRDEYAARNNPCSLFAVDNYLTRVHSAYYLDSCPVTSWPHRFVLFISVNLLLVLNSMTILGLNLCGPII